MKLYMHPVSNTSRPVILFIEENKLPVDMEVVDLMTGAHLQEPYLSINPNGLVPALVDGDFVLTESSSIIKYLADKFDLPTYPKDLKARAKVNELMDWFNTNFYRDYAYGVVYPQVFPHHKRPSEEIQKGTVAWGKELTKKWLQILNGHWLGKGQKYLTGDEITIADYFGAALLTCGEPIGTQFENYPNIEAWLQRMAATPNWAKTNEALWGFRDYLKGQGQQFETV
jgi:glutathione S-transferase